jgi:hypothetical protein
VRPFVGPCARMHDGSYNWPGPKHPRVTPYASYTKLERAASMNSEGFPSKIAVSESKLQRLVFEVSSHLTKLLRGREIKSLARSEPASSCYFLHEIWQPHTQP